MSQIFMWTAAIFSTQRAQVARGGKNRAWLQLGILKLFPLYISNFGRNIIQAWDENIAGNN